MIEKNFLTIKEVSKIKEMFLDQKKMDRMFCEVNANGSLKEALSTFTKSELDDIKQTLGIVGVSSLKKLAFVDVLSERIKSKLSDIIKRLTESEYKLLQAIVHNGGVIKFDNKNTVALLSLRRYGIVITTQAIGFGRCLLIPQELRPDLCFIIPKTESLNKNKPL